MPETEPRRTPRVLPARSPRPRTPRRALGSALLLLLVAWNALPARSEGTGTFSVNPSHSSDGVYQLEWTQTGRVRIEESTRPDFRGAVAIYEGTDRATTLSGRVNGLYHYRLVLLDHARAGAGDVTGPPSIQVEVAHHPLSRALGFFTLGLIVFISTVGLVAFGDRSAKAASGTRNG